MKIGHTAEQAATNKHKLSRPKFVRRRAPDLAMAEEIAGCGVPDARWTVAGHLGTSKRRF